MVKEVLNISGVINTCVQQLQVLDKGSQLSRPNLWYPAQLCHSGSEATEAALPSSSLSKS